MKTQREKIDAVIKAVSLDVRHDVRDLPLKGGGTLRDLMAIMQAPEPSDRKAVTDFKTGIVATPSEKIAVARTALKHEDPYAVFRSGVRINKLVAVLDAPEI